MNELEKIVYDIICSDEWPPSEEQHWEGYTAKRIVAALEPLITAAEREHIASEFKNTLKVAEKRGAAAEREACAGVEVHLTTPARDYTNMSPLDAYETALMDAAIAFREAIRARGQE